MNGPAFPAAKATGPSRGGRPGGAAAVLAGTAVAAASVLMGGPLPAGATAAVAATGTNCAPVAKTVVSSAPWPQQTFAPQRAWTLTRGTRVVVGVVDTGVSAASPALAGAVLPGRDMGKGGGRADNDCSGHGTFVAGLLAARPTAGHGLAGVAPGAWVLPIRVTADQNTVDAGMLASGIRAAVDGGAKVVAVALSTATAPKALRDAVKYAAAHDVLIIASTEGSGLASGDAVYPAALPGVVAVAPVGPDGKGSTTGSSAVKPTLAAPGSNLVSVAPQGDGNVLASGSGVAVAFVAGAAALVRDYRPRLTAVQVTHRLEITADHPSGNLPDPLLGYGNVDPVAAVVTALPEEAGEKAPAPAAPAVPQPLRLPVAPRPKDRHPAHTALTASATAVGGAVLGGLTLFVIGRGRRRGWRPGVPPSDES